MEKTIRAYEDIGVARWDSSTAMIDLSYQSGGLLKLKMQLSGERATLESRDHLLAKVKVELAEIVGLCTFIAKDLNLDLSEGFRSMIASDAEKIKAAKLK